MENTVYTDRRGFVQQENYFYVLLEDGQGRIIIGGTTAYTPRPDIVDEL